MTDRAKDNLSRWGELITKVGVPTALLVVVLYYVRIDMILPANEERRMTTQQLTETNRSLATSYEKMTGAVEMQTELLKEIRDDQRRGK